MNLAIKSLEEEIQAIKRDMDLIIKAWTTTYDVTPAEVRNESRLQVCSPGLIFSQNPDQVRSLNRQRL